MIIKVSIPNRFQLKTIPSFRTVLMPRQEAPIYCLPLWKQRRRAG